MISEKEWRYEAWFTHDVSDYYIVEEVPEGFRVRYENTGRRADVADRCYNGGQILNDRIPRTGDRSESPWWGIGGLALGLTLAVWGLSIRKRSRKKAGR